MAEVNNLSNEIDVRKNKILSLKENGEIVYKSKFDRTCTISEARQKLGEKVKIAGNF